MRWWCTRIRPTRACRSTSSPDWPRIRGARSGSATSQQGLTEDQALKSHLVEAIRYAASLLAIPAELDTSRVWILPRKLERTPTHKIKYVLGALQAPTRRGSYENGDPGPAADARSALSAANGCGLADSVPPRGGCAGGPARRPPHGDRQLCRRLVSRKRSKSHRVREQ